MPIFRTSFVHVTNVSLEGFWVIVSPPFILIGWELFELKSIWNPYSAHGREWWMDTIQHNEIFCNFDFYYRCSYCSDYHMNRIYLNGQKQPYSNVEIPVTLNTTPKILHPNTRLEMSNPLYPKTHTLQSFFENNMSYFLNFSCSRSDNSWTDMRTNRIRC